MKDTKDKDPSKPHRHIFQVQTTPKGIFPLFSKASDAYLYEKKFYLDLPQQIIPPKSFRYPFSLESFCKTDLLTMTFELKKTNELLLTDPKLNTPIHRDFINNSLELIFEGITPQNKDPALKRRILDIIERNDDISKSKKTQPISKSFYLRNSTYLPGSLNIYAPDKYRYQNESKATTKTNVNKAQNASQIKTQIDKTFEDIKCISKGYENKNKKGVTVTNVYNVLPLDKYPNTDVCEYIFPIDPNMEIDINEHIQLPQKFLLYNNNTINKVADDESDVLSLFKHEKMKTTTNNDNSSNETNNINIAEFYSHEKDYIYSSAHEYELFNRSIIFLDKEKETAFVVPVKDKITLKKYKKAIKESNDDDNDDRNYLGSKHERDIVVEPEEIDKEGEKKRNMWLRENGFNYKVECVPIMEVNYDEVKKVKKEKKKEEDVNMMISGDNDNEDNGKEDAEDNIGIGDEDEESEEDDIMDHRSDGESEGEGSKDKEHEQEGKHKGGDNEEEEENENENDALFSEDDDELNMEQEQHYNNNNNNNNAKHNDNKLIED